MKLVQACLSTWNVRESHFGSPVKLVLTYSSARKVRQSHFNHCGSLMKLVKACLCALELCVEWGSTNTSWHIGVHYVNIFTHPQSVKLKPNGIWGWGIYGLDGWGVYGLDGWGIYGLNGWDIYGSNRWGSYGKVSYCFLEDMLKKHWSSWEYPFRSWLDHGFRSL